MRELLKTQLKKQVLETFKDIDFPAQFKLEDPPKKEMGDYSTNIAMVLSGQLKMRPRDIATQLTKEWNTNLFKKIEIAGPGFINFFISEDGWQDFIEEIIKNKRNLFLNMGKGQNINIEFVSANPTGPLHIGHGRGAAVGASLSSLLTKTGFNVINEYYINDAGNQMKNLAESLYLRYMELLGEKITLEKDHYKGEYIINTAKRFRSKFGDKYKDNFEVELFKNYAVEEILNGIKKDLNYFRVNFDKWFSEKTLYEDGVVKNTLDFLNSKNLTYKKDGAVWFKAEQYGDEKDRVLIRSNGEPTYFFGDISYHKNKIQRGFDKIINIWGADHHGYEARLRGVLKAIGIDEKKMSVIFIQLVSLIRESKPVAMSTRSGEFITLKDVLDEVGVDATRFFFVMRRSDSHLDFDLDLAKKESSENPVFYVQYAHARIASILRLAKKDGINLENIEFNKKLIKKNEIEIIKKLLQFKTVLEISVRELSPHRIPFYLIELAREFHQYYNNTKILVDDLATRQVRVTILILIKKVIAEGLEIIGVNAPEKM